MGAQEILAGVSGALSGGLSGYQWGKERQDRKDQQTEQNRLRKEEEDRKKAADAAKQGENDRMIAAQKEIIESLPDTNPDGSPNTLKTALRVQYGFKGNLGSTIVKDAGQTERHNTVSGDTTAKEAGATNRKGMDIDFGYDKLFTDSTDRRHAVDTQEQGRNSRWMTPSGNARLGSETTRRGQDIGASTATRGQDVTAATATRGQDVRSKDSRYRADKQNALFQGLYGPTPVVPGPQPVAPTPAGGGSGAPQEPDNPSAAVSSGSPPPPVRSPLPIAPRAAAAPKPVGGMSQSLTTPTAPTRSPLPIAPRAAAPSPAATPMTALTAKATTTLAAYNVERDPAKKRALAAQLAELKRQRDALLAGGGPQ